MYVNEFFVVVGVVFCFVVVVFLGGGVRGKTNWC